VTWQLLSPLSDAQRERVVSATRHRQYAKGEVLFHEGDPGESLHLVRSGRFAVRVSIPTGDSATLGVVGPGDSFGELALLGPSNERTATVVALEGGETLTLTRADFSRLREENPGVEALLLAALARRIDELSRALLEALYVGVDRRVVRRLLDLAEAYPTEGEPKITIPITQDDLAGMAGASRPTVNQVLQRLAGTGAVSLGRSRITIDDLALLRRRAGPAYG
jgi:CRP-like cAMP-binding protein